MIFHWEALPFAVLSITLAIVFYLVRRAETQNGKALLGWNFLSWNADKYPILFKFRLARFRLVSVSCGLTALVAFAKFLGIL